MDRHMFTTLFDYHYGLFDRIWDCVAELSAEQFVEEKGYSLGSIRNHLVHCANVDDRWLARLQGLTPPDADEADFPNQASARALWDDVRERVLGYVNSLDEAALDKIISVALAHRFPEPKHATRREVLLHVVNHGTDHRAQILARLDELGAATLEQDLILYLWDKA